MRNKVVFGILIFLSGTLIGKLLDWGYFELSREISVIDCATLLITVALGLYITKILEKEVQDNRVKKDLYISKFAEIELLLSKIEDMVEEDVVYAKIVNKIHICGVKRNSIIQAIKQEKIMEDEKLNKMDDKITKRLRRLKRLTTKIEEEKVSWISSDEVKFSLPRILEIHTNSHLLKDEILQMKILINLS